jgi:hypothetical protein
MPDNRLNIRSIYNNLKSSLLGTKSDKVDKQIDGALERIRNYSSTKNRNAYIDTLKTLVTSVDAEPGEELLGELNRVGGIEAFQQGDRLTRYKEYEEIIRNIAYCQRALRVLTDNILSPDDISKKSLRIVTNEDAVNKQNSKTNDLIITRIKEINKNLQIEKKLDQSILNTLKRGDHFIEILYSPKGEQALTIINESENVDSDSDNDFTSSFNFEIQGISKQLTEKKEVIEKNEIKRGKIVIEYNPAFGGTLGQQGPIRTGSSFSSTYKSFNAASHSKDPNQQDLVDIEDTYGKKTKDDLSKKAKEKRDELEDKFNDDNNKSDKKEDLSKKLSDIFITLHDPQYVIRLETERFRTCLGYLVFPKIDAGQTYASLWSTQASAVDAICLKIIEKLQSKIATNNDKLPKTGDLRDIVHKYLKGIKDQEDLKIRYVAPELMSHWRIGAGGKYDPYGESILDSVKFDCKLYMALKTAMTIKRLTSATDKRVIKVETGLPRNAKNLVEMMKEGLRKRKYSIDQFGSVDSIPSHITTFEDIYIPTRDGKAFVEIDKMDFGPDPQQDTEPLKFIRDNIVANLMVPPAFVGLEENTCLPSYVEMPLLDGTRIPIGKLVDQYLKDPNKFDQWVYSYDNVTGKVVPGKISKAMYTRKDADVIRIWLDNNKYVDCTPDHRFMMRDGTYKEAKDLLPNDSLMPLYIKDSVIVVKLEVLTEKQDCCDLEIEKYHNFALDAGVFVHNSNRALLTVESIQFSRTVIGYQSEFSIFLKDLFEKVYNFIFPTCLGDVDHVAITLPPPKASTFEHMMEYLEQLQRVLSTLDDMGIPKEYSKRKFLPDWDWDEIDKIKAESELKKELGTERGLADQEQPAGPLGGSISGMDSGFGDLGGGAGSLPPPV